ncbi:hypothetical protein PN36_09980 [Candidatus Thiomargarita nelsonii]|uniref:Uncharacterized protein n=1 Tax=Candidatus Thiomargarita nelsonii TaxID=1003181 RepID=A0A0A6P2N3_9GAMM|nr:hypothetical protein PN36_09980 [Candidatus Thiomargarita nelsonii]
MSLELTPKQITEMGKMWGDVYLSGLGVDERLAGLPPKEVMSHFKPQDVLPYFKAQDVLPYFKPQLAKLSLDEIKALEKYLSQLKQKAKG